ncbi:MAG: peptidoglycan-binding protein, partial [Hyphomicrobiales bacterium]
MTKSSELGHPHRRAFLRTVAAVGGAAIAGRALAQDAALQALIDQNQGNDLGQGFDSGSRTIQMPKASLPTLSPATVQHTEQAIGQFDGIVAKGGWPEVGQADRIRVGARHPSVTALRQRLTISGDLDANVGVSDVFDSYVEAGVRRFQARHGISVDGVVREQTLKSLNVPATVRLSQLRTNLTRLRSMSGNLGNRYVLCNIPAARI